MPDGCAIVTGSARGIGAATASALAADGWPVVVNYRSDADNAEALATSIEADGGRAVAVAADVTDPEQVAGALRPRSSRSSARCSCSSTTPASAPTASPRSSRRRGVAERDRDQSLGRLPHAPAAPCAR